MEGKFRSPSLLALSPHLTRPPKETWTPTARSTAAFTCFPKEQRSTPSSSSPNYLLTIRWAIACSRRSPSAKTLTWTSSRKSTVS